MLRDTYRQFGAGVAEVGLAFSSADFTTFVDLSHFTAVPLAAARLCQWTWMCAPPPVGPDVHANDEGYRVIAQAFADVIVGH